MTGNETPVTVAETDLPAFIAEHVRLHGFITITTHRPPVLKQTGYAVSPYPHRMELVPLDEFTAEFIRGYVSRDFLFLLPEHYLHARIIGGSTVMLEVAIVTQDEDEARAIAQAAGLGAYTRLNSGRSVRTD